MNFSELLDNHMAVIQQIQDQHIGDIQCFAEMCAGAIQKGNVIFFMGNGGSAADSQHLAAEFVGRFVRERKALPAIALTTDTSLLTAIGNDYGFEQVFVRQVNALVRKDDVVVGISTSGNSPNVVKALQAAKAQGAATIGLTGGSGGIMRELCDACIVVPSKVTARIQEAHILIGHMVCEYIDEVCY